MDYTPRVGKMHRAGQAALDDRRTALLYDRIESVGLTGYDFLVEVVEAGRSEPILYVASERNRMSHPGDGWSHFLGVFDDQGHHNLGASDRWADPEQFFPHAVAVACRWLGIGPEPAAHPDGDAEGWKPILTMQPSRNKGRFRLWRH